MSADRRVITGVSGSARNLPALRYAAALAHGHAATLVPLMVWLPPGGELFARGYPASPYLWQEWEEGARERLTLAINAALGGIPDDVPTEPLTVAGEPGQVLVRTASRPGDLLVIGTGRHGAAGRLAGGKVSRYCLARASCPVLAVPPALLERETRHRWTFRHREPDLRDMPIER